MATKAISTIGTVLKFGTTQGSLTQLCKIKSFPQLGGEREQIEVTDLEDEQQAFVPGVQSISNMQFTANYLLATYQSLKTNAMKPGYFELDFGGSQGKATWEGQYDVFINEGGVNDPVTMTLSVYPSTTIDVSAASTT